MAVELREMMSGGGEHAVAFYDDEAELARSVGAYLATGAQTGEVGVVIATTAHLRAFEAHAEAAGLDLLEARRSGMFVSFDAAATLKRILRGGTIDLQAFDLVVGEIVRAAARRGPVRAYGEMVALLWEAGHVLTAIELEKAWNELRGEIPFSLLCAYPAHAPAGFDKAICELHTSVHHGHVGGSWAHWSVSPAPEVASYEPAPFELEAVFPAEPGSPRAARRLVVGTLRDWGHDDSVLGDAALVVTELVTNAVVHARSSLSLSLIAQGSVVRIAVQDAAASAPVLRAASRSAESGRGLQLIAAVAKRWGVRSSAHGKVVWAELRS